MLDLKQMALQMFHDTLAAVDIPATMRRKLSREGSRIRVGGATLDLAPFERICTIAIGKASVAMASGLAELLSPAFRADGIVVAPSRANNVPAGFRTILAGHPVPNEGSFAAGRAILDLLATANDRTLVFFLLSGGGSALVEQPLDPAVGLADIQALNRLLVTCGASIDEINAVRKHLSVVKGGRLAVAASAAMKITLGVTDVPDGRESALASGPTLPDPTTVSDACSVIESFFARIDAETDHGWRVRTEALKHRAAYGACRLDEDCIDPGALVRGYGLVSEPTHRQLEEIAHVVVGLCDQDTTHHAAGLSSAFSLSSWSASLPSSRRPTRT